MERKKIAVVTPVFEDKESFKILCSEIAKLDHYWEIFAIDDGSVQNPMSKEDVIVEENLRVRIIKLVRNVGHQKALAVGLNYVAEFYENYFDFIVTMDSDGEDIPEKIDDLINSIKNNDVAVASRKKRNETLKFRVFYMIYKFIFYYLTGRKINFGNFILYKPIPLKRLVAMNEIWIHLAATVLMSKLRISYVLIDRGVRYRGISKMNFVGLVLHGFRALMVFAEDVLVRIGVSSIFIALFSIVGIFVALILKLVGNATPGWFSVAVGILFLLFLQTGVLAMLSLMMMGVVKNNVILKSDYKSLVETVYE